MDSTAILFNNHFSAEPRPLKYLYNDPDSKACVATIHIISNQSPPLLFISFLFCFNPSLLPISPRSRWATLCFFLVSTHHLPHILHNYLPITQSSPQSKIIDIFPIGFGETRSDRSRCRASIVYPGVSLFRLQHS